MATNRIIKKSLLYYQPKVGETIGCFTILAIWIDENKYAKYYKAQCSCGNVREFVPVNYFKGDPPIRCTKCKGKDRPDVLKFKNVKNLYGEKRTKRLAQLKHNAINRAKERKVEFYKQWKELELFAKYLSTLDNFNKFNDNFSYELDRIDNSKGYIPGNIRIVTYSKNNYNKEKAPRIIWKGVKTPLNLFLKEVFNTRNKDGNYNKLGVKFQGEIRQLVECNNYTGEKVIEYVRYHELWSKTSYASPNKEWEPFYCP